jgi:signal transduction histidine kinase
MSPIKGSASFIFQNFSFLDFVPIGAFILRDDYSVIFWNSCVERWSGISKESILGTSILDHFPNLKKHQYSNRINAIFDGGPPAIFSSKLHKHLISCPIVDGGFQTHQTIVTAIQDKENDVTYALFTLQDLTDANKQISKFKAIKTKLANKESELKNTLLEVNKANEELERFAYVVSHDMKAPLRGIHNLITWIQEDLDGTSGEASENLKLLQAQGERMTSMIDAILNYSKVTSGPLKMEEVDVQELLNEIISELAIPSKFLVKFSTKLPVFISHRTKLKQVFSNLISNAIKYHNRPNGLIEISASKKDEEFEFVVTDDGPGIAPKYHKRIFEIFKTIEGESKKKSSGVGLAIVAKIVKDFRGTLVVESDVGKGASFKFTHPKIKCEMS